ncbi:MAG: HAD family hydrolase [Myxococcota bacterium]
MAPPAPRYPLYVFDFDGTLADTRGAVVATYLQTLAALGLPPVEPAQIVALMGLPLGTTFERVGVPPSRVPAAVGEYRRRFKTVGTPLVALFDGVRETLLQLREGGSRLAVASSRGRDSLRTLLAHLGIAEHFQIVIGEEDVVRKKPEPEAVARILEHLDVPPFAGVVVGDTVFDLEMGRAAGCATCGVTYGSHAADQLAPFVTDPRHLLDRFDGLLEL